MTASEVIEEIKRLSPQDQEIVQQFVGQIKPSSNVKYLSDQDVRKAADQIFAKHQPLFQKLAQ